MTSNENRLNPIEDPFAPGQWCKCKHHRKFHERAYFGSSHIVCRGYAIDGSENHCGCEEFEADD